MLEWGVVQRNLSIAGQVTNHLARRRRKVFLRVLLIWGIKD